MINMNYKNLQEALKKCYVSGCLPKNEFADLIKCTLESEQFNKITNFGEDHAE